MDDKFAYYVGRAVGVILVSCLSGILIALTVKVITTIF